MKEQKEDVEFDVIRFPAELAPALLNAAERVRKDRPELPDIEHSSVLVTGKKCKYSISSITTNPENDFDFTCEESD